MLFFLENLVDWPKVKIRNVIQEGTEAFLILSCQGHWYRLARSYKRCNTRGSRNQANLE